MIIFFDNQISYSQQYVGRKFITNYEKKKEDQVFFDLANIQILKCKNLDCETQKNDRTQLISVIDERLTLRSLR